MSRAPAIKSARLAALCAGFVVLAGLVMQPGLAQDGLERAGYFEVRSASTQQVGGVHTLDARLQLVLSSEALEALSSGVPLTIELQLEVIRVRRFVWDDAEAELALRYELEYRPLSQRYLVRNLNSGDQETMHCWNTARTTVSGCAQCSTLSNTPRHFGCCSSGVMSGNYKANGLNGCSNAKKGCIHDSRGDRRWPCPGRVVPA